MSFRPSPRVESSVGDPTLEGNPFIMKSLRYYVYILASDSGTLYTGVTNNLIRRVYEHKNDSIDGFSKKYQCHKLVLFEEYSDIRIALEREKQIKNWRRDKKEDLISMSNPKWIDLYSELL
jgi:putative endonuclease